MPSEKKRQRQQRVRHEAGDSVVHTSACELKDDADQKSVNKEIKIQDKPIINVSVASGNDDFVGQANVKKTLDNSIGKVSSYKDKSRGRGRGANQMKNQRDQGRRAGTYCVAFEEEREYEPVTIMPPSDSCEVQSLGNIKYRRREVISNWLRYDELPSEDVAVDGEDYMLGEDFSQVLELHGSSTSGGFLHLKGETSWGQVNLSHLGNHGLGALKVADLAAALATIPFQQLLKIPENALPVHNINMYNADAEINKKTYKPDQEYVSDIATNEGLLENLKLSISDACIPAEETDLECSNRLISATEKFASAFTAHPNGGVASKYQENASEPKESSYELSSIKSSSLAVNEISELKQMVQNLDKTGSFIDESEIPDNQNKTELTEQGTQLVVKSVSNFNFGLPPLATNESSHSMKLTDMPKIETNKVEPEISKERIEYSVETELKKVDISKIIKPILESEEPTVKEPVCLVFKTEMENLEDWLDSVLDD